MPSFSFQTVNGDLALFDGGKQVCRVSRRWKWLQDVVFQPGGEPLLGGRGGGGVALYWRRPNCNDHVPDEMKLCWSLPGAGHARVTVLSWDHHQVLTHQVRIEVTWSERWESYLYDVCTSVKVGHGGPWRTFEEGWYDGMEFFDFYPVGVFDQGWSHPEPWPNPNPPQFQPWGAPERYQAVVYTDAEGQWRKHSLNRLVARWSHRLQLGGLGLYAFAVEKAGNPVVQLAGPTLRRARVSLCHMMYDAHFVLPSQTWVAPGAEEHANYRLFAVGTAVAREWLRQAIPPQINDWDRWRYGLPVYAPPGEVSTFDRVVQPDRYDPAYHWMPTDCRGWEGYEMPLCRPGVKFAWQPHEGRDGKGAIMVWSEVPGAWGWVSYQHPVQVKPHRRYRLSAWIRTRNVRGRGTTIGITGTMPIGPRRYPDHRHILWCPLRLKGTRPWTRVVFDLPIFGDNSGTTPDGFFYRYNVVRLWLAQEGNGTSWFDDVLLEPVGSATDITGTSPGG